jgi:hypothetical protein
MRKVTQQIIWSGFALVAFAVSMTMSVAAQDVTHPPTTKAVGEPRHEIEQTHVTNAEVIHVSNHQIVVKLEDGRMEFLNLPEDQKFQVDGRELTIHELKPGTKITQELHTVTTPQEVTTLRTVKGKVWQINPPHLILDFGNGNAKSYTVPDGIVFHMNGEDKTVFDLRKGMNIDATVLTTMPQNVVARHHEITGQAPETKIAFEGPLLLESSKRQPLAPTIAAVEPPSKLELPKTASPIPLMGLLGFLSLAASGVLAALERIHRHM